MKRPNKEDYKPLDLSGDMALAKWMIDYSAALDKYIDHLENQREKNIQQLTEKLSKDYQTISRLMGLKTNKE